MLAEHKQQIGNTTNNVVEYRGLIAGLEEARRLGADEVAVRMDSEAGRGADGRALEGQTPRHGRIAPAGAGAGVDLRCDRFQLDSAGKNKHADRLANEAMDGASDPDWAEQRVADPPAHAVASPPSVWTGNRGGLTRLLLLRHGQTELSRQRRYQAAGNPELTETGRRQAADAARYLAGRGISAVVSSPLQRAYDTAKAVADALALPVTVDQDPIETDW